MVHAIPFVTFNGSEYSINQEAVVFLNSVIDDLATISIVGKYRSGKSFFLNRCLLDNFDKGFDVGSSIQACTKGIWIYNDVVEMDGKKSIIMDTEGLGSLDADGTHDSRIFSIAMVLSSYFIYNSVGSIDENAIQNLSFVTNISKNIKVSDEYIKRDVYPDFMWLIRDFTLGLVDTEGNNIDSDTYLENALSGDDEVRSTIVNTFRNRVCRTLVRPCNDENDLRLLKNNKQAKKHTREKFNIQMNDIRKHLHDNVKIKQIMSTNMNGPLLCRFATEIITSINAGNIPVVEDMWSMMSNERIEHASKTCEKQFELMVSEMMSKTKLNENIDEEIDVIINLCMVSLKSNIENIDYIKKNERIASIFKLLKKQKHDIIVHKNIVIKNELLTYINNISNNTNKLKCKHELKKSISNISKNITFKYGEKMVTIWKSMVFDHIWEWFEYSKNEENEKTTRLENELLVLKNTKVKLDNEKTAYKNKYDRFLEEKNNLIFEMETKLDIVEKKNRLYRSEIDITNTNLKNVKSELKCNYDSAIELCDKKSELLRSELSKINDINEDLLKCNHNKDELLHKTNEENNELISINNELNIMMKESKYTNEKLTQSIHTQHECFEKSIKKTGKISKNKLEEIKNTYIDEIKKLNNVIKNMKSDSSKKIDDIKNSNDVLKGELLKVEDSLKQQILIHDEYKSGNVDHIKRMECIIKKNSDDNSNIIVKIEEIWKKVFDEKRKEIEILNKTIKENQKSMCDMDRQNSKSAHELKKNKRMMELTEDKYNKKHKKLKSDSDVLKLRIIHDNEAMKETLENVQDERNKIKEDYIKLIHTFEIERLQTELVMVKNRIC